MAKANQYGPWATSIDAGGNPQLSTFWRRRLTKLVPTSQTSPTLSRRNLLCLSAAAVLVMIVPTVRLAVAAGDAEPSQQGGANTVKATDQASPSKGATAAKQQGGSSSGDTIVTGIFSTASSPMDFYLPSIAYHTLNSAVIRRNWESPTVRKRHWPRFPAIRFNSGASCSGRRRQKWKTVRPPNGPSAKTSTPQRWPKTRWQYASRLSDCSIPINWPR